MKLRIKMINFAIYIRYAYQIEGDSGWHYLGNHNTVLLTKLAPGHYKLRLRATNALGQWNPKVRTLDVVVRPKLTETLWFQMAVVLLIFGLLIAALLTRRYINRIKAKQRETLAAYLALLEKNTSEADARKPQVEAEPTKLSAEDDAFMSRVVAFVDEHISDSDITINDMATAAFASRSSLNRKMKQLVGLTPADFLREARIKHACTLLVTTDATIADITYRSGFTDPKYFSRVFRHSIGMSPTDYRANHKPARD